MKGKDMEEKKIIREMNQREMIENLLVRLVMTSISALFSL